MSEGNIQNKTGTIIKTQDIISGPNINPAKKYSLVITNDEIGGGSVNEKKRHYRAECRQEDKIPPSSSSPSSTQRDNNTYKKIEPVYNPSCHRSHLLHAIEGLNRYPNYLSRWKNNDVEALEQELQRVLQQVQEQKINVNDQRHYIQLALQDFFLEYPEWKQFSVQPESWDEIREILDPRAANAIFRSQKIREMTENIAVNDVIAGRIRIELDTEHLEEWIDEEMFDVYSFPLLSKTFCRKLCLFASSLLPYIESSPRKCHNLRSCYKDMDNLGLGWLNDLVFHLILRPISAQLYIDTELEGGDLDWCQGFIAAYSSTPTTSKPRQRLVPHTDDAEITLNLCFGDQFDGGDLHFWGVRGDQTAGNFIGEYQPEIGRAVIHSGRHLHEVTEVTSGDRFAFIQWARSWGASRKQVCPCCWLNRRTLEDKDFCVCGRRWN